MRLLASFLLLISSFANAEFISIKPLETCFSCSSAPSPTFYKQGKDSKVLLIFIPGGSGYLALNKLQNIDPQISEIYNQYSIFKGLNSLANSNLTRGQIDFVALDSPIEYPLTRYPAERGGFDHMIRIESVIRFYKEKTGLPVWLIGHSNGGISLTEFFKYAKKNNKTDLISGFIVSGVRSETSFDPPYTFPMLFMHHEKDGCNDTLPKISYANYEKVKSISKFPTEFTYVTSGSATPNNPCLSGLHMYNGASEEFSKYIDEFIFKYSK
jgi:hypothetical protein